MECSVRLVASLRRGVVLGLIGILIAATVEAQPKPSQKSPPVFEPSRSNRKVQLIQFIAGALQGCPGRVARIAGATLILTERHQETAIQLDQLRSGTAKSGSVLLTCFEPSCITVARSYQREHDRRNDITIQVCGEDFATRVAQSVQELADDFRVPNSR